MVIPASNPTLPRSQQEYSILMVNNLKLLNRIPNKLLLSQQTSGLDRHLLSRTRLLVLRQLQLVQRYGPLRTRIMAGTQRHQMPPSRCTLIPSTTTDPQQTALVQPPHPYSQVAPREKKKKKGSSKRGSMPHLQSYGFGSENDSYQTYSARSFV